MKTVLKRMLSLVLCLVLLASTMSVGAFTTTAADDFSYKTYAENSTKENVHYLFDFVDGILKKENLYFKVAFIELDFTSIDKILETIDDFRLGINGFKLLIGDLKDLNLKALPKKMSRVDDGDAEVMTGLLKFAKANVGLISKVFSSEGLNLGSAIEDAIGLDGNLKLSINDLVEDLAGDSLMRIIIDLVDDLVDLGLTESEKQAAENDIDKFIVEALTKEEGTLFYGARTDTMDNFATDIKNGKIDAGSVASVNKTMAKVKASAASDGLTVEQYLGKLLVKELGGSTPIRNEKGVEITKDSGATVWEVLDYLIEFFWVDKGLDEFFGINANKASDFFDKIDIVLDKIGLEKVSSEEAAMAMFNQLFGEGGLEGAVKVLCDIIIEDAAANQGVTNYIYSLFYNFLNTWKSSSTALKNKGSLKGALTDDGLSNIVIIAIDTVTSRTESACALFGILAGVLAELTDEITINETIKTAAKAATCTAGGQEAVKRCEVCARNLKSHSVAAKGHEYVSEVTKEATCTEKGQTTHTCVYCDNSYKTDIAAKGHTTGTSKVTKKATCTAQGTRSYYCKTCNAVIRTEAIAATGHTIGSSKVTKKATCTKTGVKTYYCKTCGAVAKTETIAATGHKSDGGKVTKKATYKATGKKVYTCKVCKATIKTKTISMLTLAKPTKLKASANSTTSAKISWKKVTGAESYKVSYSTNGKKWTTVSTKKTSLTIKKLKAGTAYKVKVVAIAGKNKSKASAVLTVGTKPAKAVITSVRSPAKKILAFNWKKVAGATGYQAQYSTSKKFTAKTTKTSTIKKAGTVKLMVKKLKSKKKYFVRVRAYKTVNGEKLYGAYSAVKSVKLK